MMLKISFMENMLMDRLKLGFFDKHHSAEI